MSEVEKKLLREGYEGVVYLTDYDYADAFIGVTINNQAVYDYEKMVEWLMKTENMSYLEAIEWIDYNTIRALPYVGEQAPIIIYPIHD